MDVALFASNQSVSGHKDVMVIVGSKYLAPVTSEKYPAKVYQRSPNVSICRTLRTMLQNCTPVFNTKSKKCAKTGTEAIRTKLQSSKPKQVITKITNSQNTKITYGQPSEQLFPKRWPLSNLNRTKNNMNTHKVKRHRNS